MNVPLHKFAPYFTEKGLFNNLQSFEELETRIEKLSINNLHTDKKKRTNEQTKGDAFEVFVEALLNTSNRFDIREVYSELKAPSSILDKLNLVSMDMGADGIYISNEKKNCTYQVKYRQNNSSLTWKELSTFIGVSEKAFRRHLITNTRNISDEFLNKKRILVTGREQLLRLTKKDFVKVEQWLKQERPKKIKARKDLYQIRARDKIINQLKKENRTTVIMACGAGKTLVGLWAFEKMWKIKSLKPKRTVIFVPSIGLVKQIRADWLEQTIFNKKGQIRTLQICSSRDRSSRDDEIQLTQQDLDFDITTNVKEIKNWINKRATVPNIIFCTYQSSPTLAKALGKNKYIDFAIFDEAHRTARVIQSKNKKAIPAFSFALDDKNLPIKKRLFMTATRRISKRNEFYKEGDPKMLLTMDNESVYGKVCENLTFYQAAKKNIIARLKIIVSYVTSDDVSREKRARSTTLIKGKEITSDQIAHQIAIRNATKKYKVDKIFTFHNSVSRAQSFTSNGPEGIKNQLNNFYTNHIHGEMRTKIREIHMDDFKQHSSSILSNARCLIEGVDVPSVNLVAFIDPKQSEIDIVQATGRALRNRKQPNKKYGYVLVPIFIEKKKNETMSKAFEKTNYEKIALIIKAIKEYDDELSQIIYEVLISEKRNKGFRNRAFKKLSKKIEGIHPLISKEKLLKNIKTQVVDKLKTNWDEMVSDLVAYKDKYGDCDVAYYPVREKLNTGNKKYFKLGQWVHLLRIRRRQDRLFNFQIKQLDKIGFQWLFKGETLYDVKELLNESSIRSEYGIQNIARYREKKFIIPNGYYKGNTHAQAVPYYSNKNIKKFLKLYGITLKNTKNLFVISTIAKKYNLTGNMVTNFYLKKKLKPVGFYFSFSHFTKLNSKKIISGPDVSPYFKMPSKKEILKMAGADVFFSNKYISETEIISKGQEKEQSVPRLRKKGKIKSLKAISKTGIIIVYTKKEFKRAKKLTWGSSTLDDVKGLISEPQLAKILNNVMISDYRKNGKIKPVGFKKLRSGGLIPTAFYSKDVIDKYYKMRGVTLKNTTNLLREADVAKKFGIGSTSLAKLRKKGKIKAKGNAIYKSNIAYYYTKDVFKKLDRIYPNFIRKINKNMVTFSSDIILKNKLQNKLRTLLYNKKIKPIGLTILKSNTAYVFDKKDIKKLI